MADSNVASLQNQLNRFAQVAGYAALGVDGIMGPNTGNAILKGLAYVANNDSGEQDTAGGLAVALVNNDGSINYAQMSASAYGLATYFGQIADSLNLAAPGSKIYPVASGGGGSHSTQQVLKTPNEGGAGALATNLLLAVKNLPTWAKVAGGMSLALVTVAAVQHAKQHHGSLKGFMGFEQPQRRRRRYA